MPNNLFYNTGITTYIWVLSNNKAAHGKGKVQLIDANPLYRKLRKNLGNKNCEFAPEHIKEIVRVYREMQLVDRQGDEGIASKVFDNADFGYYKVTIERPKRLKSQFSLERIAELRFDKSLREPMEWAYQEYGDEVYTNIAKHEKDILDWCERQELNLNAKQSRALTTQATWTKQKELLDIATELLHAIGTEEYNNFNAFAEKVDAELKNMKLKLTASEKNAILNAVSWYDAESEKVVKGTTKLSGEKLDKLLQRLGCKENELADYGYFPTDKKGEYLNTKRKATSGIPKMYP
jgi:type I restriction enzyme M protein